MEYKWLSALTNSLGKIMLFCFKQSRHDKKCFISVNRCNYKQSSLTRHWCACLVIIIMMKFMTLIIRHVNVIAYNLVLE